MTDTRATEQASRELAEAWPTTTADEPSALSSWAQAWILRLQRLETEALSAGEVGYLIAGVRVIADARVGDTVVEAQRAQHVTPLPGYRPLKPMVFSGLYPIDSEDYDGLRHAMERLRLNDAAFSFEPETSVALGFGFRCGYLGLLHMEIVQEGLER